MRRALRWVARALATLVLLIAAAGIVAGVLLWRTLPPATQTARIPGLSAPVSIDFDADGIPRIQAGNAVDGAAALGFVHARDRLFQMDLMRRAASGRLSELVGPATVPFDRQMRVLGLRHQAEAELAGTDPAARAMLDAYARGVNAWIGLRGRFAAPEFLVLGKPEPWTAVDCLLWEKTLALWLSSNWRAELTRMRLSATLPADRIDQLWPIVQSPPADAAIFGPQFAAVAGALLHAYPVFPARFTLPAQASNEWAVTGAHTATGAPLLAGDPHLGFDKPGIWYLARIDTPHRTLAGATAPGVPFLVIGRNSHIAWTFTTTGADTEDLFIETPTPDGGSYLTPDGPRPFSSRREVIHVRGAPDVVITVRSTRHGPVISDVLKQPTPVLAVQMAALAPGDTAAMGLLALNDAAGVTAAGRAAALITAPVQNLLVADAAHIGLFVTGRVPVRRSGDGEYPVAGADGAHDWIGWASGEQLPHVVDPPSGRLVNGNEKLDLPGFDVFMGRDGFGDWRSVRIRQMLDALPRATVEDFTRMQADVTDVYAQQLLPILLRVPATGLAARALDLLRRWDAAATIGAPQPLILDAWLARFRAAVIARAKIPADTQYNHLEFVQFVLSPQGGSWCGGDCTPMLARALADSVAGLSRRYGPDPAAWRWGAAHRAIFAHPILGRLPLLGPLTISSIEAPGDETTVDRGGMRPNSFEDAHGAAYRGVYDLSDLDRSRFVVAPGQSGNPLSALGGNFVTRWRDGATIALRKLAAPPTATIRLVP